MTDNKVKNLIAAIPHENAFGEQVTLVAAVKYQSVENINRAVAEGIRDIGDNHVQEFREKYDLITGNPRRHFIGHLQTNKVKYLIGKVDLYHSLDRLNLAEELSKRSQSAGVTSNVLIQINIGNEPTKGGFSYGEAEDAYSLLKNLPALKIRGLMAMLPDTDDEKELLRLAKQMRSLYDKLRDGGADFKHLSVGMSGDWKLCVEAGSNMIRLGTAVFGARNYPTAK